MCIEWTNFVPLRQVLWVRMNPLLDKSYHLAGLLHHRADGIYQVEQKYKTKVWHTKYQNQETKKKYNRAHEKVKENKFKLP